MQPLTKKYKYIHYPCIPKASACLGKPINYSCVTLRIRYGASLSEPHSNIKIDMVVHVQRTTTKMEMQHTSYILQFDIVVHVQTNKINLRILPYK